MQDFFLFLKTWFPLLQIPLVSALVGWGTNYIALKMTFYPIEYVGIRPFGWQGIIPAKAKKMAEKAVDLLTIKLIRIDENFGRIDAEKFAEKIKPELEKSIHKIIDEVMEAQIPTVWGRTPQMIRLRIYEGVKEEMPFIIHQVMQDLKMNIKDILDLKALTVEALTQNKTLLNDIFLKCGKKEFKFIEESGFYFGILFGLPQIWICYYYNPWWMLPLSGLIVGYITNWLAIKMIFEPKKPRKIGNFVIQGLFLKRQNEVAKEYSVLITSNILTTKKMFDYIVRGKGAPKFAELVRKHIGAAVEKNIEPILPLIELLSGGNQVHFITNIACHRFMEELPIAMIHGFDYAEEALDMQNILESKMKGLSVEEFEGFLRPPFQEDELTLIIVGAILGALAGFVQYLLVFA